MDRIERLLDALNNPEKYSSEELELILQDAEIKEIFDLLDKTKSSLQPIVIPDIDDEWVKFKNDNINKRKSSFLRLSTFFSRKIAASFIIAIISITAVAAIVGINVNFWHTKDNISTEKELTEAYDLTENNEDNIKTTLPQPIPSFETVVFDNEPLENIMKQIGEFYGYKINFQNDIAKSLRLYYRWNQASTINEIVESLNNFEQINLTIESETIKID